MSMTTNLWRRLKDLLPGDPLLIGDVVAVDTYSASVMLPDGSLVTVRGDAQIGQKVFIRAGVIEGMAPALPIEVIEV